MKFLIISEEGCASGLAWKLKTEGHDVYYFVKEADDKHALDGMVKKLASLKEAAKQSPDVVVIDGDLGVKDFNEQLKKNGWKVIGGSDWGNKLVNDQKFANKVMETFQIRSPRSFTFSTLAAAQEFVTAQENIFSFESGEYCFTPKTKTELVQYMKRLVAMRYDGKCTLSEVVSGQDVSIELWYSKGKPLAHPITKLDTNTLMNGDMGDCSYGQTSLAFAYPTREPKLVQESLKRMQIFLERIQYTGFICLYGTVKKSKFYGKYFSTSVSASTLVLLQEPLGDVLNRMANVDLTPINWGRGYGYSIKISIPENYDEEVGHYIDVSHADLTKMIVNEMEETKEGYFTTGDEVVECVGYASNMFDAEKTAMDQVKSVSVPCKQARTDGIKVAMKRIDELSRQGYEMPPFPEVIVFKPKEPFKPIEQEPVILPQATTIEAPREDGIPA